MYLFVLFYLLFLLSLSVAVFQGKRRNARNFVENNTTIYENRPNFVLHFRYFIYFEFIPANVCVSYMF